MTRTPRFNHVALTLPRESLSPEARKEILDFYGDVFGWTELEQMTKDYQLLVLSAYDNEQFVYLDASDKPMQVAATDGIAEHFGMSVGTMTELDEMCGKAKAWSERDTRVRFIEKHTDNYYDVLDLTSFYVQFLFPLMIEVQHFDWHIDLGQQVGK